MIASLASLKKSTIEKRYKNNYFTKETDVSIKKFIDATTTSEKNEIFEKELKTPFTTLVNNLIMVYKMNHLDNFRSLRDDCVRYLYQRIDTYDSRKCQRSFSYFNVMGRNWLFMRFNQFKKNELTHFSIDNIEVNNVMVVKSKEDYDNSQNDFFTKEYFEYLRSNLNDIIEQHKEREQKVLYAIVFLLSNPDNIDIYNKKAIYIYLKEITGLNSKQIISSLNKIKSAYYDIKKKWIYSN